MNNFEIIVNDVINANLMTLEEVQSRISNGEDIPFHTFNAWRKMGYQVQKGEKAVLVSRIWDAKYYKKLKEFRENGGKEEEAPHMWKCNAYLFSKEQVAPIGENSQNVKMAKGEVSEKNTRKTKTQKTTKKSTRKSAPKVAKVEKKEEKKETKKSTWSSRYDEATNTYYVSYERKPKKAKKVEAQKSTKTTRNSKKKGLSVKYDKEYYIATRNVDGYATQKVKGCELTNIKSKGIFVYKKDNGSYSATDIASGLLVKNDSKLKDLIAWLDKDETIDALKKARSGEVYEHNCELLKNAIATA